MLAVRGEIRFVVEVAPRFDYARAQHVVELTRHGALFRSPELNLSFPTDCPLELLDGRDARAPIALRAGETATFVLERVEPGEAPVAYSDADIRAEFDATVAFWRRWLGRSRYSGRWRETVHRSALTLKLLTYAPSGAIVAAPTTSLPERIGGKRNWDYRYAWMRDAAFTLYALLRLGFIEEAGAFMNWLEGRFRYAADRESGPLQIMYGIDGREDLPEEELSHLEGYMGSAPVRIGNGAATQLQLDIYGELADSLYLCNKFGLPVYHDGWIARAPGRRGRHDAAQDDGERQPGGCREPGRDRAGRRHLRRADPGRAAGGAAHASEQQHHRQYRHRERRRDPARWRPLHPRQAPDPDPQRYREQVARSVLWLLTERRHPLRSPAQHVTRDCHIPCKVAVRDLGPRPLSRERSAFCDRAARARYGRNPAALVCVECVPAAVNACTRNLFVAKPLSRFCAVAHV